MKVLHFNYSAYQGGAARAARRIHNSLINCQVDSNLFVNDSVNAGEKIHGPNKFDFIASKVRSKLVHISLKNIGGGKYQQHSVAFFPSSYVKRINSSDADIVHLHWINREMLSIADIGKIKKPLVWTLHDMWPFAGAEHLCQDRRWQSAYDPTSRSKTERGIDIDHWVYQRKLKHWKRPMDLVAPSNWMADSAKKSILVNKWPIKVIPNCLDTNFWKPGDQDRARELLSLPQDKKILLFGSYGGNNTKNKGFDLLLEALLRLQDVGSGFHLAIIGDRPTSLQRININKNYFGHISDDHLLRDLYRAADVVVVPSRLESFGQVASEAQACGSPVVAFATTGLKDVISHKQTGYLANTFDPSDLSNGVRWVTNIQRKNLLKENAARRVRKLYSYDVVSARYLSLYKDILKRSEINGSRYTD